LFGATSFVSELPKASITRQEMNISRIVNLAIRSPEFFCGVRKATKGPPKALVNCSYFSGAFVTITEEYVVALFGHFTTCCAD
jgi:hypothetical protein